MSKFNNKSMMKLDLAAIKWYNIHIVELRCIFYD